MHRTVNGTSLYLEDSGGPGPVVLFSHGLLLSCRMFDEQVASLRDRYRCVAYDHRGQGRSADSHERAVSIETCTADAMALIEQLACGPVHFVGLSMGGFVGMRVAARRPDLVASLTLLNTSAEPEDPTHLPRYRTLSTIVRWFGPRIVMGRVMPILFGHAWLDDPQQQESRALWRRRLNGNRRSIVRAVAGVLERDGVAHELGRITCPVGVAVGEEDVATPPALGRSIAMSIPGSTITVLPRGGHSSAIEQPHAVTRVIESTIARA